MKGIVFFFIAVLSTAALPLHSQEMLPYKNPALPVDQRVRDLLARMTVEEKLFQLFMIPGDLDNKLPGQYSHGIFGLQVSASGKDGGSTQQLLTYNTAEDALALTRKINSIQKYFVEIPGLAFLLSRSMKRCMDWFAKVQRHSHKRLRWLPLLIRHS